MKAVLDIVFIRMMWDKGRRNLRESARLTNPYVGGTQSLWGKMTVWYGERAAAEDLR